MKKLKIENQDKILDIVLSDPNFIKYLDLDDSEIEYLLSIRPELIKYIDDPKRSYIYNLALTGNTELAVEKSTCEEDLLMVIEADAAAIRFIENPSEILQLKAVEKSFAYNFIKNPTKAVTKRLLELHENGIKYVKDPSNKIKKYAVKKKSRAILHIENPSMKLIKIAIGGDPSLIKNFCNKLSTDELIELVDHQSSIIPFINNVNDKLIRRFLSNEYIVESMSLLMTYTKDPIEKLYFIKKFIGEIGIDSFIKDPYYVNASSFSLSTIEDFIDKDCRLLVALGDISESNQNFLYDKYGFDALLNINEPNGTLVIRAINDGFNKLEKLNNFSISTVLIENMDKLTNDILEVILSNKNLNIPFYMLEYLTEFPVVKKEIMKRELGK